MGKKRVFERFLAVANLYNPARRQVYLVKGGEIVVFLSFDFDFNIPTALKGWVGQAAKRTGALHINCILGQRGAGALHIIISTIILLVVTNSVSYD